MHPWQSPLGGESTGIHSPCRVCHCSMPPTTLNASPHEAISKGLSCLLQRTMLLVRLPGIAG